MLHCRRLLSKHTVPITLGRLRKSCFSILIFLQRNHEIGCTYSDHILTTFIPIIFGQPIFICLLMFKFLWQILDGECMFGMHALSRDALV